MLSTAKQAEQQTGKNKYDWRRIQQEHTPTTKMYNDVPHDGDENDKQWIQQKHSKGQHTAW